MWDGLFLNWGWLGIAAFLQSLENFLSELKILKLHNGMKVFLTVLERCLTHTKEEIDHTGGESLRHPVVCYILVMPGRFGWHGIEAEFLVVH